MGGEIGKMADRCYLQKRVLNASKVAYLLPSYLAKLPGYDVWALFILG